MTGPATTTRYTPIGITTAEPGWRAVVEVDDELAKILEVTDGLWVVDVTMWAVVRRETVDTEAGTVVEDLGNGVEGMVPFRDGAGIQFVCAQEMGRARYVRPDPGGATT